MRYPKIGTAVLFSFLAMLALLGGVASTSVLKLRELGRLAGDLNGRLVIKTRLADDIVDLGHQIRFADAFLLQSATAKQDELVEQMIAERLRAVTIKTSTYENYVDTDLERSLLRNIQRSRSAYLAVQAEILAVPAEGRLAEAAADEERLATSYEQARRMALGLAHVAEAQAREAREVSAEIAQQAEHLIIGVAGAAGLIGLLILLLLRMTIFLPLARITRALTDLSHGRFEAVVPSSSRGDEIDAMAQAFDVFRRNAIALTKAHEEARAAHHLADSLARHDALTGLPNRRVLASSIDGAIARSRRRGAACGVLVLDLDRFKPVNDIHGHAAGDKVLVEIANRLNAIVRAGETAARLGGDEFAVVIEYETGSDAPMRLARRIIAGIATPISIDGTSVVVGTSIGISLWPNDGDNAEALLHAADLAMFRAKRDGRGSFRCFEPDMDVELRARADREARIRHAIAHDEVRPHYQPLFDLRCNRILGFEILARWYDGDTVVPPDGFIPLAEDAGLISDLTASVLRQACRDAKGWPNDLTLALNVTPAQISNLKLPEILFRILEQEDFLPTRLELEVTESALIGDITAAKAVIEELRRHGIRISLDDFGTGYSSLHHLRDLKFDKIKIDRSFVQTMFDNNESATIVETIIGLGRNLNMLTIAEGIENIEHLKALIGFGCEYGQGYHLGKPLSATAAEDLLARQGAQFLTTVAAE